MKKFIFLTVLYGFSSFAQEQHWDSIPPVDLDEVILITKKKNLHEKQSKPLTSLDEYLEQSAKINMVSRGGYAWEPLINGMTTERTLITINGMRIFGACTDKMDPITSYVEVSNLSEAKISSGQQGNQYGATIGGSIDLKSRRSGFKNSGWNAALNSGFETNGNRKILGADFNYSNDRFFVDTDFMYRDSDNYEAGGDKEILFSQLVLMR